MDKMTIGDILDVVKGGSAKPKRKGHPPKRCDVCDHILLHNRPDESPECYDAKTKVGPWAWMCRGCFIYMDGRLGTGRGQKYTYNQEDKQWYKEEG
jgi:hypothetical protein